MRIPIELASLGSQEKKLIRTAITFSDYNSQRITSLRGAQ